MTPRAMMKTDPFWYTLGPSLWTGQRSVVATLGPGIDNKPALLTELAEQLGMPDDAPASGMTWDDLVARLSELDWPAVEDADVVAILHVAVPRFSDDVLAVYLDALRRAIDGRGREKPRLIVAFPNAAHMRVATLTRPG